jgi:predicted alpha/beta superfamily hydrolase
MLKNTLTVLLLALAPAFCLGQAAVQPAQPRHIVMNESELRDFHSNIANRDYELYIQVPDSARTHPEKKYPVVYLTDAYWSFIKVSTISGSLWYDKIAPEYIIVGIGYAGDNVDYNRERMFELSPTALTYGKEAKQGIRMGGSRQFLSAIKEEIIPYVEKNLPADPSFRVIMGSSMGGLFSLYAMYEEPGLFQGVIASSPAVQWDYNWIFRRENELEMKAVGDDYKSRYHVPARLFMSVGDAEWPEFAGEIKAFDQIIRSQGYEDFAYEFRLIEGERHGGSATEAFQRGLRFVFQPQMPSKTMPVD